jgi:hypothetical protein
MNKTIEDIKKRYWYIYTFLSIPIIIISVGLSCCCKNDSDIACISLCGLFIIGVALPIILWLCYDVSENSFYKKQRRNYLKDLYKEINDIHLQLEDIYIQVLGEEKYKKYLKEGRNILEYMCYSELIDNYSEHSVAVYNNLKDKFNNLAIEIYNVENPPEPITFTSIGFSIPMG